MLGRILSLFTALMLACAPASAYVPERSIASPELSASPAKTASRDFAASAKHAAKQNPAASVCRVWKIWSPPLNLTSSMGFTGYYVDQESSQYYAQQRYYRQGIGRFLSVDPWGGDQNNPITLNKYIYANGNPLVYRDPDGRCSVANEMSTCQLWGDAARLGGEQGKLVEGVAEQYAQQQRSSGIHTAGGLNKLVVEPLVGLAQTASDATGIHWEGDTLVIGDALHANRSMRARGEAFTQWADDPVESTFAGLYETDKEIARLKAIGDMDGARWLEGARDAEVASYAFGAAGGIRALLTRPFRNAPRGPSANSVDEASESARVIEGEDGSPAIESSTGVPHQVVRRSPSIRFYVDSSGETLDAKTYARNSKFRQGTRESVWESAVDPETGLVRDPLSGVPMRHDEPWDMGHRPGMEYRKERDNAINRWLDERNFTTRKEFLDRLNDSTRYRPELPASNRGHKAEDASDFFWE